MHFWVKTMRKKLRKGYCFIRALSAYHINHKVIRTKFPHHLSAHAAGRERPSDLTVFSAANGDGPEIPVSVIHRLEKSRAFRAVGRAIGGIFNVAALVHRSVCAQKGCADFIAGLRHIGLTHSLNGQFYQFFRCHYKHLHQRISRAKLSPGVSSSTPRSSATVAAMSAKHFLVPRFTGFTLLPSTSSGTYSLVWSVVAV